MHGAAVGGGLGLALVADFRVTCQEARFSANFNRLGFHPGFGLTATLPRLVGAQQAALLFYTGRRIPGDEAVRIGLADLLVPQAEVRSAAQALALEIAQSAPLAVMSTRETVRRGLSMRSRPPPSASSSSRIGCAAPKISPRASRRWPTAASPISEATDNRHQNRWRSAAAAKRQLCSGSRRISAGSNGSYAARLSRVSARPATTAGNSAGSAARATARRGSRAARKWPSAASAISATAARSAVELRSPR